MILVGARLLGYGVLVAPLALEGAIAHHGQQAFRGQDLDSALFRPAQHHTSDLLNTAHPARPCEERSKAARQRQPLFRELCSLVHAAPSRVATLPGPL
jgi:hypothetical protein